MVWKMVTHSVCQSVHMNSVSACHSMHHDQHPNLEIPDYVYSEWSLEFKYDCPSFEDKELRLTQLDKKIRKLFF